MTFSLWLTTPPLSITLARRISFEPCLKAMASAQEFNPGHAERRALPLKVAALPEAETNTRDRQWPTNYSFYGARIMELTIWCFRSREPLLLSLKT